MNETSQLRNAIERVRRMEASDQAINDHLSISVLSIEIGTVTLAMHVGDVAINSHRVCHGGYLFTLADTAFSYALATLGEAPVTLQASISYLRAVPYGQSIRAIARVSRSGSTIGFADVKICGRDGEVFAEFSGTALRRTA